MPRKSPPLRNLAFKRPKPIDGDGDGASGAMNPLLNGILAALPKEEYKRLLPHLHFVDLELKQALYKSGDRVQHGYFPVSGMVSLVVALGSGDDVEVAIIGRDGFGGSPLLLGGSVSPYQAVVQGQGGAFRIKGDALVRAVDRNPRLRQLLHQHLQFEAAQMSQSAACLRFHSVEERLARWLLTTQDRLGSEFLPLTHEFLAQMLGANRSTVTLVARVLQSAGLIRYSRGQVAILDREGLENVSCECYQTVRKYKDMLLPDSR